MIARALFSSLLLSLLSLTTFSEANEDTVLSYNVLCNVCSRDPNIFEPWNSRRDLIFDLIDQENPGLMAIQEVYGSMLEDFEQHYGSAFSIYTGTLADESLPVSPGHLNIILYRKSDYKFLRGGSFRLADLPLDPSPLLQDAYRRTCTWAVLQKSSSQRQSFRFLSCHLPFRSLAQSKVAVQKLSSWLWTNTDRELPQIVAGDFNLQAADMPIRYLLKEKGSHNGYIYPPQFEPLIDDFSNPKIDYILRDEDYKVQEAYLVGQGVYAGFLRYSDHPGLILRGVIRSQKGVAAQLAGPISLLLND